VTGSQRASIARREQCLLAAVALLPFAVFAAARFFGYVKHLKLAGLAALAVAGAGAVFLFPRRGLWLVVFYVYAGLGYYFPFNAAMPLAFLVFAAVLLELACGDRNRLDDLSFLCANAFFVLVSLQSMLFARNPVLSLVELSNYLKMLLVTFLIVQLVRTPDDLRRLSYAAFAGAVATVFLGLANLAFGIEAAGEHYVGEGAYVLRFTGAHENPNRAAAFMCAALPFGLFAVKHGSRRVRLLGVAGVVVLIVAIFATFSRSVVVPFTVIAAAVLLREVRSRRSYLALVALLAVGILLAPGYYWERLLGLREALETTSLDWSVYTRMLALRTAWEMFLDHPLTGVGLGNFIEAASYQLFVRIVVHNSYLEILVGAGIFGLVAFLWMLFSGIRHAWTGARHRWRLKPAWVRSLSFYFFLSGVSIYLSALFGTMPFRYPLWIPVAAGLVIGRWLREEPEDGAGAAHSS
jgi:O-antigen ligase